ncbi:glycoside hydrolase family 2 protein [Rubellicoccus peritrichatus]|uniref:Beta-mannosidase B n=1 Tax=Rubellicoccus peritrichatus TaxID=3080537 RepID=A0AAQ3LG08_9BACT|nr:sugar-binding domain-containing protein [Puniceicoccus sp. CR14]WOO43180.1 glycoside hydrolase family 2 TIM barrel-domain containing protein [Puniceicoccus sp. CR14]
MSQQAIKAVTEIDLSGNHWKMQGIRPGAGIEQGFPEMASEYQGTFFNWNQATVPGDVYTDLQRNGEIDDPYFGRNFGKAKWVQELEFWYFTKFNAPKSMEGRRLSITFEGVDYSCEAWLNGHYLGSHEGMFSKFECDITDVVRFDEWYEGCNILMVKLDPPPRNHRQVAGRKFCFGGDYMPDVVPFGIWRPVKLRATGDIRIEATRVESRLDGADAIVCVEVELHNPLDADVGVGLDAVLQGENFGSQRYDKQLTVRASSGLSYHNFEMQVKQAKLWWPWDMGEQHLYQLDLTAQYNGTIEDSRSEVIGIREIAMEMNPGFTEDEVEYPWTFVINGKPAFLRSACWGGQPSMLYGRNTDEKYRARLEMVLEANINNLRIFGWHPPEVPYFYELCDRLGITVWTNFSFATQAYSAAPQYLEPAVEECVEIVKDRRNHPSCIFFMGGEEVYFSQAHVESGNKQIMQAIGAALEHVTNIPYGDASPLSGEFGQALGYKPKESSHANEHYYAAGLNLMEEYYTALDYCVIPELTAASAPAVESLRKFIPEDELWPMGPSWGYHWADIDILKNLNVEVFGDECTGSLEEFVEATQIAQGMIFQFALEHFRRRKPRVSAVALCHFMTHMPDIKWGIIDYYGNKKLSFDDVARAYQPLLVSLEYSKRRWLPGEKFTAGLFIVNDFHQDYRNLLLSWKITDSEGQCVLEDSMSVDVETNSSCEFQQLQWKVDGVENAQFVVSMRLETPEGELLSCNHHTLLIGDQKKAKEMLFKRWQNTVERKDMHGKSYYRYFPELQNFE